MKKHRGFTLIELLIVFAIIGIIAAIAIPSLARARATKSPVDALTACRPVARGEGIWYFSCNDRVFSVALAEFLRTHRDLRVSSIAPASNEFGQYAATVITEPALPAEAR